MSELQDIERLNLKLGRKTEEGSLDPIPRDLGRENLENASFYGYDLWNAYEVSFLLPDGKPVVRHMRARYPADTPFMIESKSFKLYLNSLNNQVFPHVEAFSQTVAQALSQCVDGPVDLTFYGPDASPPPQALPGVCLDDLAYQTPADTPPANMLKTADEPGTYQWHSHLLRSNCPVTHQPDWGSVLINLTGKTSLVPETLLAYVVAYRNHQGFHESCCEAIFHDLQTALNPDHLEVTCLYTRRGGLDINPFRSLKPVPPNPAPPAWRQ